MAKQATASANTPVYLEIGAKRTFASAADWPGWCRSGKNEQAALEALGVYAPRYARVVKLAKVALPASATHFEVVERLTGNATTDFGAPGIPAKLEARPLNPKDTDRMVALLEACWSYLDQVVEAAPQELRKGPRGGGRDRDKMFDHVIGAEVMYASAIGVRVKQPDAKDSAAIRAFRTEFLAGLRRPSRDTKWSATYCVRRTAWHALDHAWEIEDRIP